MKNKAYCSMSHDREKEQSNNSVEKKKKKKKKKRFIFKEIDKEKEEKNNCKKEVFSADLAITFVLVTVLSVSCSYGGLSLQIQMLEGGEFWVLM